MNKKHKHLVLCKESGARVESNKRIERGKRVLKVVPILYKRIAESGNYSRDGFHFLPEDILKCLSSTSSEDGYTGLERIQLNRFFAKYPGFDRSKVGCIVNTVRKIIKNQLFVYDTDNRLCGVGIWPYGAFFKHSETDVNCIMYCNNTKTGQLIFRATQSIFECSQLTVHRQTPIDSTDGALQSLLLSENIDMYIEAHSICKNENLAISNPVRMKASWLIGIYMSSTNSRNSSLHYLEEVYEAFKEFPAYRRYSIQYAKLLHEMSQCCRLYPSEEMQLRSYNYSIVASQLFTILCGKKFSLLYNYSNQLIFEYLAVEEYERIQKICDQLGKHFVDIPDLQEIKI